MNKPKIKMVEFYLKNFAPFYESMGLREFHIDKRNSPYNLTLIVGSNGSGKSFLITEISPQTIEHIVGRIANRFIEGEDGEKRIHFIVNDTYEYICTILYDKTHKTTCFLKRIELSTGKKEELNPNGNVTSGMT
jgi:predicted ATP-binding protein involved in virulence